MTTLYLSMTIISSEFTKGRVVDQEGNGAIFYTDNDTNLDYSGFGFVAGSYKVYDGVEYKEWGRLYLDSNKNGIYEGIHIYDGSSGIIPSTIGIGGEDLDEHIGYWYSTEFTYDRPSVEVATWTRNVDSWIGGFEGLYGLGRFEIISDIIFDTSDNDDSFVGSTNDDVIIWHHPFYWYSCPPLMKQWIDMVLEFDWAYGPNGNALLGKTCLNAITTGGSKDVYCSQGYNSFTVEQFLRPFEQTANLCGMTYLPPFAVMGTHTLSDEALQKNCEDYDKLLDLLQDEFHLGAFKDCPFLNDLPLSHI